MEPVLIFLEGRFLILSLDAFVSSGHGSSDPLTLDGEGYDIEIHGSGVQKRTLTADSFAAANAVLRRALKPSQTVPPLLHVGLIPDGSVEPTCCKRVTSASEVVVPSGWSSVIQDECSLCEEEELRADEQAWLGQTPILDRILERLRNARRMSATFAADALAMELIRSPQIPVTLTEEEVAELSRRLDEMPDPKCEHDFVIERSIGSLEFIACSKCGCSTFACDVPLPPPPE